MESSYIFIYISFVESQSLCIRPDQNFVNFDNMNMKVIMPVLNIKSIVVISKMVV